MTNKEQLNEFMENLFENALETYKNTKEYIFLQEKQEQFKERLIEKESANDEFLENYAFEIGLDAERKNEFVYQQGMKDCVWLLKSIGVLA